MEKRHSQLNLESSATAHVTIQTAGTSLVETAMRQKETLIPLPPETRPSKAQAQLRSGLGTASRCRPVADVPIL